MKQEIGGYLELEVFHGKEYYPDLVKVNLGRTALCWLLESRKIETLYLPSFLCDSVIDACLRQGIHVNFYSLNEDLTPALSPDLSLHPREYLYLVNYYGQLTDEKILYYKKYYIAKIFNGWENTQFMAICATVTPCFSAMISQRRRRSKLSEHA